MSRYENKLIDLTPIIWSNIPSFVVLKNIVTLPGTLLCPGTQIDNTFKLKKFQPRNERTSQGSLITSSPIGDGTEETVPGRNRSYREPTTTGVALKRLNMDAVNTPVALVSTPENARK